jgi:hypothetical protein
LVFILYQDAMASKALSLLTDLDQLRTFKEARLFPGIIIYSWKQLFSNIVKSDPK